MTQSPSMDGLEVEVKNFGPIVEAKFKLRPLTVFIGPSNSGKSYLAILIYALHRALSKEYERAPENVRRSYWEFPSEHLTELLDWINKNFDNSREAPSIENNSTLEQGSFQLPEKIAKLLCTFLQDNSRRSNSGGGITPIKYQIARCFGTESIQSLIRRAGSKQASASAKTTITMKRNVKGSRSSKSFTWNIELSANSFSRSVKISPGMPLHVWSPEYDAYVEDFVTSLRDSASMDNPMVRYIMEHINSEDVKEMFRHAGVEDLLGREGAKDLLDFGVPNFKENMAHLHRRIGTNLVNAVINNSFDPIGRPVHYLPADRAGMMHAYGTLINATVDHATGTGSDRPHGIPLLSGVHGDFLKWLIKINDPSPSPEQHRMSSNSDRRRVLKKIAEDLELNILEGDVRSAGPNNSIIPYPVFSYMPHGWSDPPLPLMHASSMVSELSPIVLFLRHIVNPGDVLIIEEPEAHLHPDLQVKFVNVLAKIVKAGVRIILTTHSEWVLDAVANLVLSSKIDGQNDHDSSVALSSQEVGLWSVVRKKKPKGSIVQEIKFDFEKGGFVTEFETVAGDIYNRWADLGNRINEKAEKSSSE